MRKLTITRNKTFVGCAAKLNVYIEDPWAPELTIAGVGCHKLGTLKNGETATFSVGDGALRVFVIADKLSRNMCNDFYALPAGEEDVTISGQCRFNPATGNAFRFDGVAGVEVEENRKKGLRRGIMILAIAFLVGAVIGFGYNCVKGMLGANADYEPGAEKKFLYSEMSIVLDDTFTKQEKGADGYQFDVHWQNDSAVVGVLRETTAMHSSISRERYAKAVLEANSLEDLELVNDKERGLLYVKYRDGLATSYLFFFRSGTAFWTVQVIVPAVRTAKLEPYVFEWAASIKFHT